MESTKCPIHRIDKKHGLFYVIDYTKIRSIKCNDAVHKTNVFIHSRL